MNVNNLHLSGSRHKSNMWADKVTKNRRIPDRKTNPKSHWKTRLKPYFRGDHYESLCNPD
jgi:hypothetical protein